MTIYIAGPMSGLPDHNRPAFNKAAADLRALGFTVINPADRRLHPPGDSWRAYMRLALADLLGDDVDTLWLLPGWHLSKGARIENSIAHIAGMTISTPLSRGEK